MAAKNKYQPGIRPAQPASLPFFLDSEFRKISNTLQEVGTGPAGPAGPQGPTMDIMSLQTAS